MRLRAAWNGSGGSLSSPGSRSCVETVLAKWTENPQDVIAWQQTIVEDLQGF